MGLKNVTLCFLTTISYATALEGDMNCDGEVNFDDFFLLADDFGKTTMVENECASSFTDMNCDGEVNFNDFFQFANNFGNEGNPSISCFDGTLSVTLSQNLQQRTNALVFKKLNNGVNIDTSLPSSGVWPKLQHEAAHFKAAADAGFTSVRVFMPFGASIEETERQIVDALTNNLAIVICMWGRGSWYQSPIESATEQIAARWAELAKYWKKYPKDLVFEILNEPAGIGFKEERRYGEVMQLYNAAVQAIRNEDASRPILIGAPGSNDPEYLDPYVTEEYLTYTFDRDKGFYDDTNAGVAIHFYSPRHEDGFNFAMWTAPLPANEKWNPIVLDKITTASQWRARIGIHIPVITTEWGCWSFPGRSNDEMTEWLSFHMDHFKKHDIGNMWYTGIQNNQRSYAIFDSELGWNQTVLDQLTGINPQILPKTSQIINSEFHQEGPAWRVTTEKIAKEYVYGEHAFSGNSMLKLTVPEGVEGQLYQQTYGADAEYIGAPGRTLLHLIEGQIYRISFTAASEDGKGRVRIRLRDAVDMRVLYDSYEADKEWIHIGDEAETHTILYVHNAQSEMDVRLEFDVGSREQVLYLDNVVLMRN